MEGHEKMKSINIKNEYKPPVIDIKYWSKIYKGGNSSNNTRHGDPRKNKKVNCGTCLQRRECKFA